MAPVWRSDRALLLLVLATALQFTAGRAASDALKAPDHLGDSEAAAADGSGLPELVVEEANDSLTAEHSKRYSVYVQPPTSPAAAATAATAATAAETVETSQGSEATVVKRKRKAPPSAKLRRQFTSSSSSSTAPRANRFNNSTRFRYNDNIQVASTATKKTSPVTRADLKRVTPVPDDTKLSTAFVNILNPSLLPSKFTKAGSLRFDDTKTTEQSSPSFTKTAQYSNVAQTSPIPRKKSSNLGRTSDSISTPSDGYLTIDATASNPLPISDQHEDVSFTEDGSTATVLQAKPSYKSEMNIPVPNEDLALYGKNLSIERAVLEKQILNYDLRNQVARRGKKSKHIIKERRAFKQTDLVEMPRKFMKMMKRVGREGWVAEDEAGVLLPAGDGSGDTFVPEILLQDTEFLLAMASKTRLKSDPPMEQFELSAPSSAQLNRPGRDTKLMGGMPYSFGFIVDDEYTNNFQTRQEEGGSDGVVNGCYQVLEPTGLVRTVIYRADHHGFQVLSSTTGEDKTPCAGLEGASQLTGVAANTAQRFSAATSSSAKSGFNSASSAFNSQASNSNSQASNFNSQASNSNSQASNFNSQASKFNSQSSNFNSQASKFNSQSSNFNSQASNFNSQASNFNSQASNFDSQSNYQANSAAAKQSASNHHSLDYSASAQAFNDHSASSTASSSSSYGEEQKSARHEESTAEYLQSLTSDLYSSFSDAGVSSTASTKSFINFPFVLIPVTTFVDLREKGLIDGSVQSFGAFVQPAGGKKAPHSYGGTGGGLHQTNSYAATKKQTAQSSVQEKQQSQSYNSGSSFRGHTKGVTQGFSNQGHETSLGGYLAPSTRQSSFGHQGRNIKSSGQRQNAFNSHSAQAIKSSQSSSNKATSVSSFGNFNRNNFHNFGNQQLNNLDRGGSFQRHQTSHQQSASKKASHQKSQSLFSSNVAAAAGGHSGRLPLGTYGQKSNRQSKSESSSSSSSKSSSSNLSAFVQNYGNTGTATLQPHHEPGFNNLGSSSTYLPINEPAHQTQPSFGQTYTHIPKGTPQVNIGPTKPRPSLNFGSESSKGYLPTTKINTIPLSQLPSVGLTNGFGSLGAQYSASSASSQSSKSSQSSSSSSSSSLNYLGTAAGGLAPQGRHIPESQPLVRPKKTTSAPIPAYLASLSDPELPLKKSFSGTSSDNYSSGSSPTLLRESRTLKVPKTSSSTVQNIPTNRGNFKPPTKLESMVDSPMIRSSDWIPMIAVPKVKPSPKTEVTKSAVPASTFKLKADDQFLASGSEFAPMIAVPDQKPSNPVERTPNVPASTKSKQILPDQTRRPVTNRNVVVSGGGPSENRLKREFGSFVNDNPSLSSSGPPKQIQGTIEDPKNVGFGHFHNRGASNFNTHFYSQA